MQGEDLLPVAPFAFDFQNRRPAQAAAYPIG
jgi:hypothetical protein